jgi:hypothetical protein
MQDVCYRLNAASPVRTEGTIIVKDMTSIGSGVLAYRGLERTVDNEVVNSGLADRLDDYTYYAN